ncbi:TRAD1 protein, partial [Podargus strigoides]|nr:TRAD1 protein [Podargus strigoides]
EQLKRNENTPSSPLEEWNADLDYVLALSLQNENHLHSDAAAEITSDVWGSCCPRGAVPPAWLCEPDTSNVVMLPCEFCEELYPADDLILHQTGCNPASAFASFSKRSSPNPREYHGLPDTGSRSRRSLSSPQLQAVQAEGNIMIPCEFCGVQLEEEMLFHHQHHCDLRPASPAASSPSQHLPAPQSNGERRAAPELARRHSRHQGV